MNEAGRTAIAKTADSQQASRRAAESLRLAHEGRNALQRSQACLELLALEIQDRPKALDLVGRIQEAQDRLAQLYDEILSPKT